jgi:hypothetical protein
MLSVSSISSDTIQGAGAVSPKIGAAPST